MPGPEIIRRVAYVAIPAEDISRELVREELAEMGAPRIDVTGHVMAGRIEFSPGYATVTKRGAVIVPDSNTSIVIRSDFETRRIRFSLVVYERAGKDYQSTFFE